MINKELVVHATEDRLDIALLEEKILAEFHRENRSGAAYSVGDIYIGRVRKCMSGLNAAFVNIGHEKDAFLHRSEIGSNYKLMKKLVTARVKNKDAKIVAPKESDDSESEPTDNIVSILSAGQPILVQVLKEAISTKGPRITAEISLTGRHVVLLPFGRKVAISQKIRSKEEGKRLKAAVLEVLPSNFGAIIRTAAKCADNEDVKNDVASLVQRWNGIVEKLAEAQMPSLIMSEENRVNTILRDILSDQFTNIYVDDKIVCEDIKSYIRQIAPDKEKIVKLYKGNVPIFDNFDVTRQIKGLFGKIVPLKRKSYMIIEHTEALHVIDINSGTRLSNAASQEEVALEVNLAAVDHIARQLRLRDMGGIVVIDFIDLRKGEHREILLNAMKEAMAGDRARHTILPLTKFGLMQITRQRVRPETKIVINECCPTCHGKGEISPSILLDAQIEGDIEMIKENYDSKNITIKCHPYLHAFVSQGLIPLKLKWMFKFKSFLKFMPDESLAIIETKYYDSRGNRLYTRERGNKQKGASEDEEDDSTEAEE